MLSVLIHGTLVTENSERGDDNRKPLQQYQQLIRKLKKELGEKHSPSIDQCRQLLPLPKLFCEVIQCEPFEADSEGSRRVVGENCGERKVEEVGALRGPSFVEFYDCTVGSLELRDNANPVRMGVLCVSRVCKSVTSRR